MLTPLSKYVACKPTTLEDQPVQPFADTVTPPLHQVAAMDDCAFFQNEAAKMNVNLPICHTRRSGSTSSAAAGASGEEYERRRCRDELDCTTLRPDEVASLQRVRHAGPEAFAIGERVAAHDNWMDGVAGCEHLRQTLFPSRRGGAGRFGCEP